ncbi:hypothetical protein [Halopenitus persicus]|uniref:Uncharacterized protein n=1 Tax=Halopenitus persicus TaxID=1048396 RepID=A0A1H3MGF1_9EURY|nr:hypothetical protein [Halopenitus persicus]SDY75716.1 hypothetical protein SAMN05216564_10988 [Halopenitus persicus]
MSVVPGNVETDQQPPMTVPLRHFLLALGFLVAGGLLGLATAAGGTVVGPPPGWSSLAHVHLLLAGWVCVTIMGAMTQFVPVWSGVQLYSRALATRQLQLVTVGLLGFATGLLTGRLALVPVFGAVMVAGFWVFAYNIARTLRAVGPLRDLDVTERHFLLALGFFVLLTLLGVVLAVDLVRPVLGGTPIDRPDLVRAHATLAVFGAILTTVLGALYQLATMFTQTELHGIDAPLKRIEEVGYPVGVLALATGRLLGAGEPGSRVLGVGGGVLVIAGLLAMSVVLARRLLETRVPWTPMLSRYAVLAPALALWGLVTLPSWLRDPLADGTTFGAPGTVHLLTLGVIGFVVLGTVYHIVPFIVWVHRYSDLLGFEDVPMIDDLYSDRLARVDFGCFLVGTVLLVAVDLLKSPVLLAAVEPAAPAGTILSFDGMVTIGAIAGGVAVLVGIAVFCGNVVFVLRTHSPYSVREILFGARPGDGTNRDHAGSGTDGDRVDAGTDRDHAGSGAEPNHADSGTDVAPDRS